MAPRGRLAAGLVAAGLVAGALVQSPAARANTGVGAHAIDGRRSSAAFVVTVRLRGVVAGRMAGVTGALAGNAATGWQVQVRLDAKGLRFDGPHWMERTTRSSTFLAVDRYPSIRFESDAFDDAVLRHGGPLRGQLTLRGLRRPVSFALLPSDCARPGFDCDIRVQGSVSRREFGMSAYRAMVADPVELRIRVRLRPGPAA
jgi:polyisoprenoid-binding protein YceI